MDLRRGLPPKPPSTTALNYHRKTTYNHNNNNNQSSSSTDTVSYHRSPSPNPKASDALPLPLYLTNGIFFSLFFCVAYFHLHHWHDKIRSSTPLHVVTYPSSAIVSLIASFIYLLGFLGINFVQSFISTSRVDEDNFSLEDDVKHHSKPKARIMDPIPSLVTLTSETDEEIVKAVLSGLIASYSLESKLGDCRRAASIQQEVLERKTGRSLLGLPVEGFNYDFILGQCCEMLIGYVQLAVGIAGPLLLNGGEYIVPTATTEGCLVTSTNMGCKAIFTSGGAMTILLKDGMTRAPVVRFATAVRASNLKFFLKIPSNLTH